MEDSWQKRWNRPPTDVERKGFINEYVRETALYRVALKMGLDKNDAVIRRLLVQKLEFIANDLIQPEDPTDDELEIYFKENIENYTPPEVRTVTQLFFDPDLRGDNTLTDVENAMETLQKIGIESDIVNNYGDRMMLQNYYPGRTEKEMAKLFGVEFAKSIFDLEINKWFGPILSGYGTHIVYIHNEQKSVPPSFDQVKNVVLTNWKEEKQLELNNIYYKGLLDQYDVVIEETESIDIVAAK